MAEFKLTASTGAPYDNNERVQGSLSLGPGTNVYTTGAQAGSTDPFTGKTNKYSEARVIWVFASAMGHIKFSVAGTAATTSDWPIAATTPTPFTVDAATPYVRLIADTGSVNFWVVEGG